MSNFYNKIYGLAKNGGSIKKGLYELHPELLERIPLLRVWSDEETHSQSGGYASTLEYYTQNVWVHKAIKAISDNLAPLELRVVRGRGRDTIPIENHPVQDLLRLPNDAQSNLDLWREWTIIMLLGGEVGVEFVRAASGRPSELWIRDPMTFFVKPGTGGRRYRRVVGYRIEDNEGLPYTLPPEEFIHFKFFNPHNPWRGVAPITAVRTSIVIDELAQIWTRLFFKNQARPDYAVIAPQGITLNEKEEIEKSLSIRYGTGAGVHKPIVLEQGVTDIKTFSWAPKDLEWLEQRRMARDEIGAVFGVPDEIMGYGKDTYENFNAADRVFWTLTIIPLIHLRDNQLTRFFHNVKILKNDERIETDLQEIPQLQEDKTDKILQLEKLATKGYPINAVNDWLGLGLPEVDGGDVGYLPASMVPLPLLAEGPPEPPAPIIMPPTEPDPEPDPDQGPTEPDPDPDQGPIEPEPDESQKAFTKMIPEYGSDAHLKLWETKQRRLDTFVNDLQSLVKRLMQRQQNNLLRALRESKDFGRGRYKDELEDIPPIERLFDLEKEKEIWTEEMLPEIRRAVIFIAERELGEIAALLGGGVGFAFDVTRPEVVAGMASILETVSRKTNETTWLGLIDLFKEAERNGEGIPAIQERLSAFYGDRKSDWQTERIARTTVTGATNLGAVEAWAQTGVVHSKTWISALIPGRTRDHHAEAHGQRVGLREAFRVDGEDLMHPGDAIGKPSNIINCLCVMTAHVD